MQELSIREMDYYCDRSGESRCVEIADKLLRGQVYLWGDNVFFEPTAENMFDTVFETSDASYREYLFAMDYLSYLLSAYRKTGNEEYKSKFFEIVQRYFEYYDRCSPIWSKFDDLIPCAQTLMFIKSFDILSYELLLKAKIVSLLYSHALYCYDDNNHRDNDNHGLFTDMALLHLSVLFESLPVAETWQKHAVKRVLKLFNRAFYKDGFNNEGSLNYFQHNLVQYKRILDFCTAYQISGLEELQEGLGRVEGVFRSLARDDGSYPIIGDGHEFTIPKMDYDMSSACYPDGGICVVKTGKLYLTFKCSNSTLQFHTHVDDSSITICYGDIDLALDCGQYNDDRYHPVNRYLRTSGGHSGVFPLFVDGLGLREYLDIRNHAGIEQFDFDGVKAQISGGYELDNGTIKIQREIAVEPERVEVRDSWKCTSPHSIRQRFALPKEMLAVSRFTVSKQMFETRVGDCRITYQVFASVPAVTTMNFGVISKQYFEYEPTILLDTIAEDSVCGDIMTIITISEGG